MRTQFQLARLFVPVVAAACLFGALKPSEAEVVGVNTTVMDNQFDLPCAFGPLLGEDPGCNQTICIYGIPDPGEGTHEVYGTQFPPSQALCIQETVAGVRGDIYCKSIDPVTHLEDGQYYSTVTAAQQVDGTSECIDPPECTMTSLINTFSDVHGVLMDEVIANNPDVTLVFTSDGLLDNNKQQVEAPPLTPSTIPGCPTHPGRYRLYSWDGRNSINAFHDEPTPAGTGVTVASDTAFFNPINALSVPITVTVNFEQVTQAGRTLVVVQSNHDDNAGDFGLEAGGFRASYLEVSTTAEYTGTVKICTFYPDSAPDDGIIDGTTMPETALKFLHGEGGVFVDRTTTRDTVNNVICALVDGLSPFVATLPGRKNCPVAPRSGCTLTSTKLGISSDPTQGGKNKLGASLSFESHGGLPAVGDPTTTSEYTLCVYDQDGWVLEASLPHNGESSAPWVAKGAGYKFKDKAGAHSGITSAQIKRSDSKLSVKIKGKGNNVGRPKRMPFAVTPGNSPAIVQWTDESSEVCLEAYIPEFKSNTDKKIKN